MINLTKPLTFTAVCAAMAITILPVSAAHDESTDDRTERQRNRAQRENQDQNLNQNKATSTERQQRLGYVMPANHYIGHRVQTAEGQRLGEIQNMVVDFESGRILFVVVDQGGDGGNNLVAVPPMLFRLRGDTADRNNDRQIVLNAGREQLANAPKLSGEDRQDLTDVSLATRVYQHWNAPTWWNTSGGKFGNVHRASKIPGVIVNNVSGSRIGTLDQTIVDVPAGRIAYVALRPSEQGKSGIVPVPPMALSFQGGNFVLNADQTKLSGAPTVGLNQTRRMSELQFAQQVYQYWGKDPWFQGSVLSPTGRDSGYYNENQRDSTDRDTDNQNNRRWRIGDRDDNRDRDNVYNRDDQSERNRSRNQN